MRWMVVATCAMLVLTTAPAAALAQGRSRNSSPAPRSGTGEQEELPPSVPPPVPTLAPSRGISGPRIEAGAVLCKTPQDLQHRAEVNRRRVEGVPDAGDPLAGCHLLGEVRAVEVLSREGLGRVQVRVKANAEVGWTDAYIR